MATGGSRPWTGLPQNKGFQAPCLWRGPGAEPLAFLSWPATATGRRYQRVRNTTREAIVKFADIPAREPAATASTG